MTADSASPRVTLRPARHGDAAVLLEWRNDAAAVRFSVGARPVTAAEHTRWLADRLADPATRLCIAEQDGVPVGQVRIDQVGDVGTVSIAVGATHRGRGLAVSMLHAVIARAGHDVGALRAVVHPDNAASRGAFERAGFRPVAGDESGFTVLEYRTQPDTESGTPRAVPATPRC